MSDIGEARWYVAHTYSGYENKVASNLQLVVENRGIHDLIQEVCVPTETVTEIKDEKKHEVERKIFPGYVLVKMVLTDETWYIVRNTRGCTGFVGPESKPIPLTDEEIVKLGISGAHTVELPYETGDSVKIVSGPMAGHIGIVIGIDRERNKVNVMANMFGGRETPTELDIECVVPID